MARVATRALKARLEVKIIIASTFLTLSFIVYLHLHFVNILIVNDHSRWSQLDNQTNIVLFLHNSDNKTEYIIVAWLGVIETQNDEEITFYINLARNAYVMQKC